MSDGPPAKRQRITGGIITITAGRDTPKDIELFEVHESKLKDRGGFFKAALGKDWKEGQERKIELPEDLPDVVATYVDYIYEKDLQPTTSVPADKWTGEQFGDEQIHLARMYVFADKVQDDTLCNDVISKMAELYDRKYPSTKYACGTCCYVYDNKAVEIIYDNLPEGSPARKFMIWLGCIKDITLSAATPKAYAFDLAQELLKSSTSFHQLGEVAKNCHKFFKSIEPTA